MQYLGEASHPAREREAETLKEGANQYMADIKKKKVFIMFSTRER